MKNIELTIGDLIAMGFKDDIQLAVVLDPDTGKWHAKIVGIVDGIAYTEWDDPTEEYLAGTGIDVASALAALEEQCAKSIAYYTVPDDE